MQVRDTEWPYTPHWQMGARVDFLRANGVRVGVDAITIGRRFHDAENTQSVTGFSVLNLRLQFQRTLHQNYFLAVTNLAGRDYETFAGFPQPGRAVLAGLEYRY